MTTTAGIGHNQPPYQAVFDEIQDLYDEAKNFADGEPITSEEMHDQVTKLYDSLHDAGKRADEMRKKEKEPLDKAVKAIQDRFNPYVQPRKGKVDLGKSALGDLLAAWRAEVARKKEEEARKQREEADAAARKAEEAMRESKGNLEERERAEELLKEAKTYDKLAKRADRDATTGTGLRTVWIAEMVDAPAALDWAYERAPERFTALVQSMADEAARGGERKIPGFTVRDERRAV